MLAITLNPGFVLILAALLALAAPRRFAAPLMAGAGALALWLLLDHEFGAAAAIAQAGVPVVLLDLDALNRIFGIAMLIALLLLAAFTSGRRRRFEDAAILLLAGAAVSALFVGDLVSFVAAASLAGLAAAWLVFCSPLEGASQAGARLLIWNGLEGLLLLAGVAFHISATSQTAVLTRLDLASASGAAIFAGLMIRVGAPLAHVWLKDVIGHASAAGAPALAAFPSMLGVYALARFFPAEPVLIAVGAAMMCVGARFAAAEADLRRATAYALMAQTGLCVSLIGIGSPLALAAAEGHAFTSLFAHVALLMAAGVLMTPDGDAQIAALSGRARVAPIASSLALIAGLACAAAPGLAVYATHAVTLEAIAQWDLPWLWLLTLALPGVLLAALVLRPGLSLFGGAATPPRQPSSFGHVLGATVACFLCLSIGLAPRWLYDLMPAQLAFQPFAPDRVGPQLELLGVAGAVFLALRSLGVAPAPAARLMDVDAVYRGPVASAARWAGVLMLRGQGAWRAVSTKAADAAAGWMGGFARRLDRPYAAPIAGFAPLLSLAIFLLLVVAMVGN